MKSAILALIFGLASISSKTYAIRVTGENLPYETSLVFCDNSAENKDRSNQWGNNLPNLYDNTKV